MVNTIEKKEGWIEKLIGLSAQNKYLVMIFVAVALVAAIWSIQNIPLDAIPDLSDSQVIIYSRWDRSPDIIEDQVTYPIVSSLLGVPGVKAIRGFSDFGYSFFPVDCYFFVVFHSGPFISPRKRGAFFEKSQIRKREERKRQRLSEAGHLVRP